MYICLGILTTLECAVIRPATCSTRAARALLCIVLNHKHLLANHAVIVSLPSGVRALLDKHRLLILNSCLVSLVERIQSTTSLET